MATRGTNAAPPRRHSPRFSVTPAFSSLPPYLNRRPPPHFHNPPPHTNPHFERTKNDDLSISSNRQMHRNPSTSMAAAVAAPSPSLPTPIPSSAAAVCCSSSGSHHDPSLHALVHHFLHEESEEDDEHQQSDDHGADESSEDPSLHQRRSDLPPKSLCQQQQQLTEILQAGNDDTEDVAALQAEVEKAMEDLQVGDGGVDGRVRRAVMSRLRRSGYNAAICKSRWSHAPGLPAGDYEYMDVVVPMEGNGSESTKKTKRYIVDLEFKEQFEIARASEEYRELMSAAVGRVFVGGVDKLKATVRAMCSAAKRSLREQGLHLPPWRKPRYMLCKWCAAYRRTTSPYSASRPPLPPPPPPPPPPQASATTSSSSSSDAAAPLSPPSDSSDLGLGLGFHHPTLHSFSSSNLAQLNHLHTRTTGFRRLASSSSHSHLPDLDCCPSPTVPPLRPPPSALSAALKLHASSVVAVRS